MARFENQFDIRDPLTFECLASWPSRASQTAWEARALLEARNTDQLKKIAQGVESLIEDQVDFLLQFKRQDEWDMFAPNPLTISQGMRMDGDSRQIRELHGDVDIFVAATTQNSSPRFRPTFLYHQWEGLAVIALWKLADYCQTMDEQFLSLHNGKRKKPTQDDQISAYQRGVPLLLDAVRASILAAEVRMRSQLLWAAATDGQRKVSEALYEAEIERRREVSSRSRAAVMVRHAKTIEHQARAIEIANSQPFKSRAAAARHAADLVQKAPGEFYTPDVVDGWLKAAGWQQKDAAPTE